MLRSLNDTLKISVVVLLLTALVTYGVVTRVTLYANTTEIQILKDRLDTFMAISREKDDSENERLTVLEKTVYAPVDATQTLPPTAPAARRPAAMEKWILNADDELRKRIKALEDWRFRQER